LSTAAPAYDAPCTLEPDGATASEVFAAMATLAPRRRACVVLRYYLDLTEVQTADALGISVGTVKSQSRDALARLRALVPDLGDTPVVTPSAD